MKALKTALRKVFPLVILLVLSLCSEPEAPRPQISSINPAEGSVGTIITIVGKNLAGAKSILFGTTSTFPASQGDTQITTVVPPGLTPGAISVTVKSDGGVSNAFSFTVLPSEPEIISIEPEKGSVGTVVSIKGKYLATAASVTFKDKAVTSFESKADDLIKVTVPDGLPLGALDVFVTAQGGVSPTHTFTVVGKPVINSFTPTFGSAGKIVTINGVYFEDASKIYFDTAKAAFTIQSASVIAATVPVNARTGKLKVVAPGGTAISTLDFTVKVAPVIVSFTPSTGIAGTLVTLNGSGFDVGSASVKFGAGLSTDVTVVNATKITVKVPATATTGKITLETPTGSAVSSTDFKFIGIPSISSFLPASGGIGATVTIAGANFTSVSAVKFNTTTVASANYTVLSDAQISVKVPVGATTGKLYVVTPGGTATSAGNFAIVPAPTITSFTPSIGPGGIKVSIAGTNFTGVTKVYFGTGEAPFEVKSTTLIEATVPTGAATGKIKVVTPGGEALSTADFTVKGAPEITTFSPGSGLVGTVVTITGKNFDAGSLSVKFGTGKATDVTVVNATQITAKVPAVGTSGKITVETASGSVLSANSFTVIGAPTVASFTPTSGISGVEVTIAGTNFVTVSDLKFNATSVLPANYTIVSPTQIKAKVPAGASTGKILVATAAGSGNSDNSFVVIAAPTVSSFTPAIGPIGKEVIVTGTGFDGATKIYFGAVEAAFNVQSSTSIKTNVPVGAASGKIKVVTPAGEGSSTADFVVKPPPVITNFTPGEAIVGATVTINGQNFDAGTVSVKFGTGAATEVTVVNATQITAKVPPSATTGKITVETVSGAVLSTSDFTVIGAPTISSFTPTSGGTNLEVTISGTNFINVSSIKFSGTTVAAGNYTVVSTTQLKAKVPAGTASGKISVTTPAGTASSSSDFAILQAPVVTSFTPANGAPGVDVTITGTGFTGTTSVRFNGVEVGGGNFSVNSATQITGKVPGGATSGKITVTNPQGSSSSGNNFYVTPFISSLNPTSGNVGSVMTITGTNLEGATAKFNSVSATPSSNTGTSITVTVPAGVSGAVNVTVVNSGGTSNGKTFTIASIVVVDEIVATENITDQLLLLKGSNLQNASSVMFGATAAAIFTNTSKVVTTKIPTSLTPGNYSVTLVTSNGTSNAKSFEVLNTQNPNSGDVNMVNGASVVNIPPGYVPPVSNQWTNDFDPTQKFLISEFNDNVIFSVNFVDQATGTITFDKANNYFEMKISGIRYVGVWRPRTTSLDGFGDTHCYAHMTLISAESGKQLELTVEIFDGCP
ncbi:MAG: IPT/TIG domain-containing protein [Chryseolinea sp.]